MPSSNTLLTIAIPTYNRSSFLDELLSTLVDQCIREPQIELLISDNASMDDTPTVVKGYIDRGLKINYLRNSSNIGADANFLRCFERATSKYIWLIGDDDVVAEGAIKTILTYLQSADYSLVYINSYSFEDSDVPNKLKPSCAPAAIADVRQFVQFIHINFTFISGVITNRDCIENLGKIRLDELVGTNLMQLGWIYAALNEFKIGLLVKDKLIGMRINNTGGYMLSQTFGISLKAVTDRYLKDHKVARSMLNGTLMRFLPAALLNLRNSPKSFQEEKNTDQILRPVFGNNFRYWIFVLPVIRLPYHLAQIWFFVIRIINKLDKLSGSYLMR